ncbi:MAG: radical SAM protein [Desulfosudis oleivorans]|nr:radical SAM protein [Desulfosudis oleivorans]
MSENNQKISEKLIEFKLTAKCNYKCAYCIQNKADFKPEQLRNANDDVVDSFIRLVKKLEGNWTIGLLGGEATIHPRFMEVAKEIVSNGHRIKLITNFSLPVEKFKEIADIAGKNINIGASLHLTQVQSLDKFIDNAIEFNNYITKGAGFCVLAVLTDENFDILVKVREKLTENNVRMQFQCCKVNNDKEIYNYSQKVLDYLEQEKININPYGLLTKSTFGTICHTGYQGFVINEYGDIRRCYNPNQELLKLGNLVDDKYKLFNKPMPCLAQSCNCSQFSYLNLIRYDEKDVELAEKLVKLIRNYKQSLSEINELTGLENIL